MTAKMTAKKMGRPRQHTNESCSTGCGAPYVPHRGSRGRCPRCSRLDTPPAEPGRFPEGAMRAEDAWEYIASHPFGPHDDWQLKAAYERLYAHAPLSALMLAAHIKTLEQKLAKIQTLAQS